MNEAEIQAEKAKEILAKRVLQFIFLVFLVGVLVFDDISVFDIFTEGFWHVFYNICVRLFITPLLETQRILISQHA